MSSSAQFGATPNPGTPVTLANAVTTLDGSGLTLANVVLTAGANGTLVPGLTVRHIGTNVATLLRVFKNNGSDPTVAANNALIKEIAIAANALSQSAASTEYYAVLNEVLHGGATPERLLVCLGTAVAAGIKVTPHNAGDY